GSEFRGKKTGTHNIGRTNGSAGVARAEFCRHTSANLTLLRQGWPNEEARAQPVCLVGFRALCRGASATPNTASRANRDSDSGTRTASSGRGGQEDHRLHAAAGGLSQGEHPRTDRLRCTHCAVVLGACGAVGG